MKPDFSRKRQKSVVLVALIMFSLVLFVLQLWLLEDGLERVIAGQTETVVPGAFISLGIFLINAWMLAGVVAIDKNQ